MREQIIPSFPTTETVLPHLSGGSLPLPGPLEKMKQTLLKREDVLFPSLVLSPGLDNDVRKERLLTNMKTSLDHTQTYIHAIALIDTPSNAALVRQLMKKYRKEILSTDAKEGLGPFDMLALAVSHDLGPLSQQAQVIRELFTAIELSHLPEKYSFTIQKEDRYADIHPLLGQTYDSMNNPAFEKHAFSIELKKMKDLAGVMQNKPTTAMVLMNANLYDEFESLAFQKRVKQMGVLIEEQTKLTEKPYKMQYIPYPGNRIGAYAVPKDVNPIDLEIALNKKINEELAAIKDWDTRSISPSELNILCNVGLPKKEKSEQTLPLSELRQDAQSGLSGLMRRGHLIRITDKGNPLLKKYGFQSVTVRQMNPSQFAEYRGMRNEGVYDPRIIKWIDSEKKIDQYLHTQRTPEEREAGAVSKALLEGGINSKNTAQGTFVFSEIQIGTSTYTIYFDETYKATAFNDGLSDTAKYWMERISLGYIADVRNGRVGEVNEKKGSIPHEQEENTPFQGRAASLHVLPQGGKPTIHEKTDTIVREHFLPISHTELNTIFMQVQMGGVKLEEVPTICNSETQAPYGDALTALIEKLLKRIDKKKGVVETTTHPYQLSVYDEVEEVSAPPVIMAADQANSRIFP